MPRDIFLEIIFKKSNLLHYYGILAQIRDIFTFPDGILDPENYANLIF